jgi:di/tricarboxylate transporter
MGFDAILVLVILAFILISLYFEIVGPAFTFVIAIAILGVFRVLTPNEILAGFANEQIIIIIMLLMLGDVFQRTSILDIFFDRVFKNAKTPRNFIARLMFVAGPVSAFVNNTPLVALLMPYVHNWGTKNKVQISRLLMPLSFATIIGGCATLIGTSTNLIVGGLVADQQILPGLKPLQIFDFASVGVPMIVIGAIYMIYVGDKLLLKRVVTAIEIPKSSRDYLFELQLKKGSEVIGQSRSDSPFLKNKGFMLVEVFREGIQYQQVEPDFIFKENDILIFAGQKEAIAELVNADKHRIIPSVGMFSKRRESEIIEIVVSHKSSMIGKRLMYENFRGKYDATVLAVHRNGENLTGKIANIDLLAGDALLLMVGNQFNHLSNSTQDFYIISKIKEIRRIGYLKTAVLIVGLPLIVILNVIGIIKLFTGILVLLIITQLLKIVTPKDMATSADYELAIIIALSLALGVAMIKTGVAESIANGLMYTFKPMGKYGALAGIYLITATLAGFITNKAAVAIIFPISLTLAIQLGVNPLPFILVVSFAAAANFMTPIGYQTNIMIYGPGGYKFRDFLRVGTPLTIIYMIVTVTILSLQYL